LRPVQRWDAGAAEVATINVCLVRTNQGSSARCAIAHITANVKPGVARRAIFAATLPSGSTSPSRAALKGNCNVRLRPEHILCAGGLGELSAGREMVGMNVGVDDKEDAHAGGLCGAQMKLDLADRIDDGAGRASTAAEQVGDTDWLTVQELTDDHGLHSRLSCGSNIQSFC
jgi:hypothetical protein